MMNPTAIPDGKAEDDQHRHPHQEEEKKEEDKFDQDSPSKVLYFGDQESPASKGVPDDDDDDDDDDKLSQLPNPDTIPRDTSHRKNRLRVRKKKACLGAVGLIAACALIVVLVSYFGPQRRAGTTQDADVSSKSDVEPVVAGTPAKGFYDDDDDDDDTGDRSKNDEYNTSGDEGGAGEGGGRDDSDAARLYDARTFLTKYGISDLTSLTATASPQRLAMEWICTSDPLRLPVPETRADPKFIQRYTLAVVYYALGGGGWKTSLNFMTGNEQECEWNVPYETGSGSRGKVGAVCDDPTAGDGNGWNRVTKLWIPSDHGLEGTLPPEIRHLTRLTSISMSHGKIGGPLPHALCSLTQLEELNLGTNRITGTLPACMNLLPALRLLALDANVLTGDLGVLNGIPTLQYVYLGDNGFEDTMDDNFLNNHAELLHLDLSDNGLAGGVPSHLLAHPTLKVLDLHQNKLTGPLPSIMEEEEQISTSAAMEFLALNANDLNGTIPASLLTNSKRLNYLDLSRNQFTGDLSGEDLAKAFGSLPNLEYLFLGTNKYDAQPFPPFLNWTSTLVELGLEDSNINSPIPEWINALKDLYLLDLGGNGLYGPIPSELGDLSGLHYLLLNRNELTGEVPSSLTNLTELRVLLLEDNSLTGSLDDTVCPVLDDDAKVAADCAPPQRRTMIESNVTDGGNDGNGTDVSGTDINGTADVVDGTPGDIANGTGVGGTDTAAAPAAAAGGTTPEIQCGSSCCTICCADSDDSCAIGESWILSNDVPVRGEHRYERYRFKFEDAK